MSRWNIVRTDLWMDAAFDAGIGARADMALAVFPVGAPLAAEHPLRRAHVYQVSAAKDELPGHLFVTHDLLSRCPDLLCVSSSGAGYDTVDVAACTAAGVAVVNQAGGNANAVAEHAMGLMLGVMHRIAECDRRMRRETGFAREAVMGHELKGKTIGLVGIGHTGSRVAWLAAAFGMRVLAHDPYVAAGVIEQRGAVPAPLDELLACSDIVSLHCPRDAGTLGMFGAAAFAKMKAGAVFISTARGGIHDEVALADALRTGHLAGAGLDVWAVEPPALDHPLLGLDNVLATYHTAGVTHEARRRLAAMAARQIGEICDGLVPPRLVNPEVWSAWGRRRAQVLAR